VSFGHRCSWQTLYYIVSPFLSVRGGLRQDEARSIPPEIVVVLPSKSIVVASPSPRLVDSTLAYDEKADDSADRCDAMAAEIELGAIVGWPPCASRAWTMYAAMVSSPRRQNSHAMLQKCVLMSLAGEVWSRKRRGETVRAIIGPGEPQPQAKLQEEPEVTQPCCAEC
jgi:hypothetical protein